MDNSDNDVFISCSLDPEPLWLKELEPIVQEILRLCEVTNWELSIHFCDDPEIKELNSKYRGKHTPTDVLSFAQEGEAFPGQEKYVAGDIIISVETVERNASDDQIPFDQELKRLLIHGVLHLKGMDHPAEDDTMLRLQEKLLIQLLEEKN